MAQPETDRGYVLARRSRHPPASPRWALIRLATLVGLAGLAALADLGALARLGLRPLHYGEHRV